MVLIHVVESDRDVADWLSHCLAELGHSVECFPTAEAFLTSRKDQRWPDLLLLEAVLPDDDGLGLLSRARSVHPGLSALFITASWSGEVLDRITSANAHWLVKPFSQLRLHAAIDVALRSRRAL